MFGSERTPPGDDLDLDLDALRAWGREHTVPRAGFEDRMRERMMQVVLEVEAAASSSRRMPRWLRLVLRNTPIVIAAASVFVVVSFNGGHPGGQPAEASTSAGKVLNQAALNMTANVAAGSPIGTDYPGPGSVPAQSYTVAPTVAPGAGEGTGAGTSAAAVNASGMPSIPDPLLIAQGPSALPPGAAAAIPTDERLLLAMLHASISRVEGRDEDFDIFRVAAEYITDPAMPITVRATFLRMLALVDGVDAGGTATDVLGRSGIVIARLDSSSGLRQQYLLDENTGMLLEHLEFTSGGDLSTCAPGTATALDVYDATGSRLDIDRAIANAGIVVRPECAPAGN